ncbi:MAG TPA: hypothetical protein VGZ26_12090 [Pirellulales bacterium]|nr:hypothetical protein [Pirellulales bacterium]
MLALTLIGALAWAGYSDEVMYEAKNPQNSNSGWHPNQSAFEIGLRLIEVFGAGAAIGAAIGELTRQRLAWSIAGIFILPIAIVIVSNCLR